MELPAVEVRCKQVVNVTLLAEGAITQGNLTVACITSFLLQQWLQCIAAGCNRRHNMASKVLGNHCSCQRCCDAGPLQKSHCGHHCQRGQQVEHVVLVIHLTDHIKAFEYAAKCSNNVGCESWKDTDNLLTLRALPAPGPCQH